MKNIKTYYKKSFFILFGYCLFTPVVSQAHVKEEISFSVPDSVGTEIIDGNRFVLHKIASQETYFQLGRLYNVNVKDIMAVNGKKSLRVGDTIKIPRGKATEVPRQNAKSEVSKVTSPPQNTFTEYKVGKSETLYAISRRFGITVDEIKKANNLTSNSVREGQLLKIPNENVPEPEPEPAPTIAVPQLPVVIEERQPIDDSEFKANRYGIREKRERGVGVWLDSFGDGQSSLALHKSAPIGTILKITNPMNHSVTFAKVVGKFADNQDTQDAIVVLSKGVATAMGILDRRFQIELNYGTPLE